MPNWCENEVTFSGPPSIMKKFMLDSGLPDTFSLDKIRPMPKELRNIHEFWEGGQTKYCVYKPGDVWENRRELTQEEINNIRALHGHTCWYSWACANWGTKWDVSDVDILYVDTEDSHSYHIVELRFDTPWNPPEQIVDFIREQYPDLDINWFYKEPGMQIAGWL